MGGQKPRLPKRISPGDRAAWSFGDLLHDHLFVTGTRPPGSPEAGEKWNRKTFAELVGVNERTVRNWLNDKTPPDYPDTIERLLFGTDPAHAQEERREFRRLLPRNTRQTKAASGDEFDGVPPPLASFVGRHQQLKALEQLFKIGERHRKNYTMLPVAIHGLGGTGKTALADQFAYTTRRSHAMTWRCRADKRENLIEGLAQLADRLGVDPRGATAETVARSVIRELAHEQKPWLLIYDDAPSPEVINDLFPYAGAHVVITSRFPDWTSVAKTIHLEVLSDDESIEFLNTRAERSDAAGAMFLARALGGLPLALEQAAVHCMRFGVRFADCAAQIREFVRLRPVRSTDEANVSATFTMAIEQAAKPGSPAERLMALLAECAPTRVPVYLYAGAFETQEQLAEGVLALTASSLAKADAFLEGVPALTLHPIVQLIAREWSEEKDLRSAAVKLLVDALAEIFPINPYQDFNVWPACQTLIEHVWFQIQTDIDNEPKHEAWPNVLVRAGSYFQARGFYDPAEMLFLDAVVHAERDFGKEHKTTLRAKHDLAVLFLEVQQFPRALHFLQEVLQAQENTLDANHPATSLTLLNLGHAWSEVGYPEVALQAYERALSIRTGFYGNMSVEVATTRREIGYIYFCQKKYEEAALELSQAF